MKQRKVLPLLAGMATVVCVGVLAAPAFAATPANTAPPTIQGPASAPYVGDKLTATNGTWSGDPTSFSYQWDRCDSAGRNCVAIAGATAQAYTVAAADVDHTLRVQVTATNASGSATKESRVTGLVAPAAPPVDKTRPTVSGSPSVGSTLTASTGTWTGARTFTFAWQQCDVNGNNCTNIADATSKTYTIRTLDVGHELRVQVTARNKYGATSAVSDLTSPVLANTTTQTTILTTTVQGNKAPTIAFLSLRRVGTKVYARFRVCDDSAGRIGIVERDNKARALAYTRRFAVAPGAGSCGTYARAWRLIPRFRGRGRLVVTLRAQDRSGRLSRLVSRSVRTG